MVLAPTLRHLEQWHVPTNDGLFVSSNWTALQQQLPFIIFFLRCVWLAFLTRFLGEINMAC